MIEFERHIEFYKLYWYQEFSRITPKNKWGNQKSAKDYLQKYWLPEQEYLSYWKPIQDKIFVQDKDLPELIYYSEFEIIVANGGCLFTKENFLQLQKAIQEVEEKFFIVVQNVQEYTNEEPMFRMKFPVSITWSEITSGIYISSILLEMNYNEYFVFGESGKWGKYSATDYVRPLDIIGFKQELSSFFQEQFTQRQKYPTY